MAKTSKKIRIKKERGHVELRAESLNSDDRTVEVIWSTGSAVKRYSWDEGYYMEELSMDPEAVRLDRFSSMSLLDTHDQWTMESRLGTVVPGSVTIANGVGTARVRFSSNEKAESIFRDLVDGHPINISVGYKVHAYRKSEGNQNQLPTFVAVDWEPMELSVVPVPADAGAYSRGEEEPDAAHSYEAILIRQDDTIQQPLYPSETPMKKRDAAKNLKGKDLDVLALGANIVRGENETDEVLSARLLAAYDAEDVAEAARQAASSQRNDQPPVVVPSQADINAVASQAASRAVAEERQRAADIRALARSARLDDDAFVEGHITGNTPVSEFRNLVLERMIEREERSPTFPHVETRGLQDSQETLRRLATNGMMHRFGLVQRLEEGANQFRSMSVVDLARELLIQRGENWRGTNVDIIKRSLHSTSDFPIILGEVTRQTMMNAYMLEQEQNTFQLIGSRNTMPDLREVKVLEMGNGPELEELTEKGEYKRGSIKESQEGFSIRHFGKVLGLTEAMLINDQLGAFAKVIANWGRVIARLEGNISWAVILQNAKLKSDNKQLFHVDHGNLAAAGAAPDQTTLEVGRKAFRKMKDIDGQQISLAPSYIFTGTEYETTVQKLVQGITVPQTSDQVVPQSIRSLQPVYESRIDSLSEKAWFLFASPERTLSRGLQYSYLSGYETPRTMERYGFDYDGVEYRLDHYFGAGLTDYRFAYKNPGPA